MSRSAPEAQAGVLWRGVTALDTLQLGCPAALGLDRGSSPGPDRSYMNVMTASRPFTNALELLRAAHLRPTQQRLALVRLLFEQGDRHVTAEQLYGEAVEAAVRLSLATVYNTLHQFVEAGLLREVV